LTAMLRFERTNLIDAANREYRRGNSWKFTALLTWALIATALALFALRSW